MSVSNGNRPPCPNCGGVTASRPYFCPHCGAALSWRVAAAGGSGAGVAQAVAVPTPAPKPGQSQGPLLTGHAGADAALGFLTEFSAVALSAIVLVNGFASLDDPARFVGVPWAVGAAFTTVLLLHFSETMRLRYPSFARGWSFGRRTWGAAIHFAVTVGVGSAVLVLLFPLGILVGSIGLLFGPLWWVIWLGASFTTGTILRRMLAADHRRRNGGATPP